MRRKNRNVSLRASSETLGILNYIIKKQAEKNIQETKTSIIEKSVAKYAMEILKDEPIVQDLNTTIELLPNTIHKKLETTFEKMEYEIDMLTQKIEILNEVQNQYLLLIVKLLAEVNTNVHDSLSDENKIENILNHKITNLLKMKINEHASNELFDRKFNDFDDNL